MTLQQEVKSPFKFLDSFSKSDYEHFYGRDQEIYNLVRVFKKSSLVVLYGPSGAGKSSLINCGLMNHLHVDKSLIVQARRGDDFILSIDQLLFKDLYQFDFSDVMGVLYGLKKDIHRLKNTLAKERDVLNKASDDLERHKLSKEAYQAALSKYKTEQKKNDELIKEAIQNQNKHEEKLSDAIHALKAKFGNSLYLIFDQFEELFVSGTREEMEKIGLFLAAILRNSLPVKILISIREEFLGKLNYFERDIPYLYHYKTQLDHPDESTIKRIVRDSFKAFNINTFYVEKGHAGHVSPGDIIPTEVREERIDEIVKQLVKIDNIGPTIHFKKKEFYLPFLQIYLDRLYKEDFERTYGRQHDTSSLSDAHAAFPPLEFELYEIKKFGSIADVLQDYMDEIHHSILEGADTGIVKNLRDSRSPIVKFLKHFVTPNQTKKGIRLRREGEHLSFQDLELNKKVQLSLWKEYNPERYNDTIDHLLLQLVDYKIIKTDRKYAELAHDILAKIIASIPVEEDIRDVYRRTFDSAYFLYERENIEGAEKPTLLSIDVLDKIRSDIKYIVPSDSEDYDQKIGFWKKSEKFHEDKLEKKLREERDRYRKLLWLAAILSALVVIITSLYIKNERAKSEIAESKVTIEDQKEMEVESGKIFKNIGDAYNDGKNNLTQAYSRLKNKEDDSGFIKLITKKEDHFKLHRDYSRDLINDFVKRPFYYMDVPIDRTKHILSTKSRSVKASPNQVVLFSRTRDTLYVHKIDLSTKRIMKAITLAEKVTCFEPAVDGRQVRILYSNAHGLKEVEADLEDDIPAFVEIWKDSLEDLRGLEDLERIKRDRFIGLTSKGEKLIVIDQKKRKTIGELYIPNDVKRIHMIKKDRVGHVFYIGKTNDGKLKLFNSKNDAPLLNMPEFGRADDIKSFIVGRKDILIAGKRVIYRMKKDKLNWPVVPKIVTHHQQEITSVDNFGDYYLVGSRDRTASLYLDFDKKREKPYDELLIKEFIGHSDAILNVSFLGDGLKHILTSGQDGTIKIWDVSSIEKRMTRIEKGHEVSKLLYNRNNRKLYAAFSFKGSREGYLNGYNDTLGMANQFYYQGYKDRGSRAFNLTSFDLDESEIVVGTDQGGLIGSAKMKGLDDSSIHISLGSTIYDLRIRDNVMALATNRGIQIIQDFNRSKKHGLDSADLRILPMTKINSVDLHPTQNWVLATSDNGSVYLWDFEKRQLKVFDDHTDKVKDACFSKSGNYFVSGSWDNTAIVWEQVDTGFEYEPFGGAKKGTIKVHTSDIEDVEFLNDAIFATASSDNTVQIHELNMNFQKIDQLSSLIHHNHSIRAVAFENNDSIIYTGDKMGVIKKWNWKRFKDVIEERREKQ